MIVVREPKTKKRHQITCINEQCQALIELETHELQYVASHYKGDYFVMVCPCCGVKTAIDGQVIRGEMKLDGC